VFTQNEIFFEKFLGFVDCIKGDRPLLSPKLLKSLIKTEFLILFFIFLSHNKNRVIK